MRLWLLLTLTLPLSGLSLEEKVGQLILVSFEGEVVTEEARALVADLKVGGVTLFKGLNTLSGPGQVKQLTHDLQAHASIPLLISIDQEGGRVRRLEEGFTTFSSSWALGRCEEPELAYEVAKMVGKELAGVGVNLNLAPVVDVNNNPDNPIIGTRAFGSTPELVTAYGREYLKGMEEVGVLSCLKHFPGHGNTSQDSHEELPVADAELYPFQQLLHAPLIMSGHLLVPARDPDNPASLSPTLLQDVLRGELGFEGVVVTDSLVMRGVLPNEEEIGQMAVTAFLAGNDLLLLGGTRSDLKLSSLERAKCVQEALLEGVHSGKISRARLDASVERILALKRHLHRSSLAKEIAYRSVYPYKLERPETRSHVAILCPDSLTRAISQTDLIHLGTSTQLLTYEQAAQVEEGAFVILCNMPPADLPSLACDARITTGGVEEFEWGPISPIQIAIYSPTPDAFQVAAEWIRGEGNPFSLTDDQAEALGDKIWQNECKGRTDQLLFWNSREPFPSIGIGHFLWPPQGEGEFVAFTKSLGTDLPAWMTRACPWPTREAFCVAQGTEEMEALRALVVETIPEQARYIAKRLDRAFFKVVEAAPPEQRTKLINRFFQVAKAPNGPYILVDYLNFKGMGTNPNERYKGQGWGLLQVLGEMGGELPSEEDFAKTAHTLLKRRIANAPSSEDHWLPGWTARLSTYPSSACGWVG